MLRRLVDRVATLWPTWTRDIDRRIRQVVDATYQAPSAHDDPVYRTKFLRALFSASGNLDSPWAVPNSLHGKHGAISAGRNRSDQPSLARLEMFAADWRRTLGVHGSLTHHDLSTQLVRFARELALHAAAPSLAAIPASEMGFQIAHTFKSTPRSFREMVGLLAGFLQTVEPADPASPHRWINVLADFSEGYAAGTRARALAEQDEIITAVATVRSRHQREPLASAERFEELFTNSPVAMGLLDLDGRIVEANTALSLLLGRPTTDLRGMGIATFARTGKDRNIVDSLHRSVRHHQGPGYLPDFQLANDNPEEPIWVRLHWAQPRPDTEQLHVVLEDITEHYVVRQWLRHLADHDHVSGLPNRRQLLNQLDRLLADPKTATTVGLYAIRLDGLGPIATTLGPATGETVLRTLAARAQHAAATTADIIAQLDPHTIAVVITNQDSWAEAGEMVKRLTDWLADPVRVDGDCAVSITPVVGAAQGAAGHTDAETLIHCLDRALHSTEPDPQRHWTVIDAEHSDRDQERNRLLARLPAALDAGEVTLLHAPVARASTGEIVGSHATLQWAHPQRWPVPVTELVDLATDIGLSVPIVPWLIRQAAAQAAHWHDTFGADAPFVRIDLPDRQVADPVLVQDVVAELRSHHFPPALLHLGMSESSIIDQHGEPCTELVELAGQGIRLVLNGLGATVRNFHLLPEFLLYGVTISPLLTAELDVIPRQCEKSVLQAMIELGRNLNLEVSVLGINTPHLNDLARHFGASTVEGLAIGAPRTAQAMDALLNTDDRVTNPRTHQSS